MTVRFQYKQQQQAEQEARLAVQTQTAEELKEALIRRVTLLECGLKRRPISNVVYPPETELILKREPDNPVDRWAIKVYAPDEVFLGYLPEGKNQSVARLMDAGKKMHVYVADAAAPEYQDALRVFDYNESRDIVLRIEMEIPLRKDEQK